MASRPGAGSASPAVGGASSSGIGSSTGLMMFLDTTSKSLVHELTRRLADNFKSPTTTDTDVLITDLDGASAHWRLGGGTPAGVPLPSPAPLT